MKNSLTVTPVARTSETTSKATTSEITTLVAITTACFDAYIRKDRAALELLIGDDFHFTSPLDNRIDRKTYFERCWPNSQHIAEFKFINVVPYGDKVFVTYEGKSTDGDAFRNTEIFTLRQEKIIAVEVYFGWSIPHKAPANGFLNNPSSA